MEVMKSYKFPPQMKVGNTIFIEKFSTNLCLLCCKYIYVHKHTHTHSLSLSFSLSHTHTQIHTHTHKHVLHRICRPISLHKQCFYFKLNLYHLLRNAVNC